ncbi:hypothetical protein [Streptomyces sp. NPDC056144]|uniref:hypothetical protein n=1 Tax=unclassified Streptomyces TaxID=2593676 RepID=UPI0035D6C5C5
MPITPHIPALAGPDGTGARVDRDILLVRGPFEEMQVYLKAVAHLRAEGRALTIELTAAAGAVPAVYRFQGADEASVAAFADAVNAVLPETPEQIDATDYMAGIRIGGDLQQRRLRRTVKHSLLYGVLVIVALAVAAAVTGPASDIAAATGIVVIGTLGLLILAGCALASYAPYRERYLRRHGVRVSAARVPGETNRYAYRDADGLERLVTKPGGAWTVDAAYDPRDPGRVVALRSTGQRVPRLLGIGFAGLFGLGLLALAVTGAVLMLFGLDGA